MHIYGCSLSLIMTMDLSALQATLETEGLNAALEGLNGRVPHRYTVIYRFDGDAFYSVAVYDKKGEPPPVLFKRVPFVDSFCQFTVGQGQFRTENSLCDRRLDGHIHQANVQSYTGLPLEDATGNLYGTFCHLDMVPQPLDESEFSFLKQATRLLSKYLAEAP